MTEKETIEHVLATGRFSRTFDDYSNYIFFVLPLAFIAIGISMVYNYFKFDSGLPILAIGFLFISLGAAFAGFILKRLNDNISFKTVSLPAGLDIDKVAALLRQNFKLRNMDIDKDLNSIVAFTKITAFSWGEQLTLVFDKEDILINSRPSGSRQPITIVKDRQNIRKIERMLLG
jgi:hypothetical protein